MHWLSVVALLSSGLAHAAPVWPEPPVSAEELEAALPGVEVGPLGQGDVGFELRTGGELVGTVRFQPAASGELARRTKRYGVEVSSRDFTHDPLVIAAADRAAAADGGWKAEAVPRKPEFGLLGLGFGALMFAAAWFAAAPAPVELGLRLTHLIPSGVQSLLFVYWGAYWQPVAAHAPIIFGQLMLGFAVEAVLGSLRGRWVVGAGPIPVVFSMNLFLWFTPLGSAAAVLVALLSKAALRWNGAHVFNPSALALCVVGGASSWVGGIGFGGLFHSMNIPPYMGELILVAALLPQLRLPIVLVTLGAFLGHRLSAPLGPGPGIAQPPTLLAMALLATDPATIPRSGAGRFLFGLTYGVGMRITSLLLVSQGAADDLSKVLPIPFCNLMVPAFDRLGARVAWSGFDFAHNRKHVALWLILASLQLVRNKAERFEGVLHWQFRTPGVVQPPSGPPTCRDNPAWCRPLGLPFGG